MHKISLILIFVSIILTSQEGFSWDVQGPKDGKIEVKNQQKTLVFEPKLQDVQVFGLIEPLETEKEVLPWVLLAGKKCNECEIELNLVRADGQKTTLLVYPGQIIDAQKHQLVLESRGFFGKCVPASVAVGDVYLVLQTERVDRKRGKRN